MLCAPLRTGRGRGNAALSSLALLAAWLPGLVDETARDSWRLQLELQLYCQKYEWYYNVFFYILTKIGLDTTLAFLGLCEGESILDSQYDELLHHLL
jgi:hypothetical protein